MKIELPGAVVARAFGMPGAISAVWGAWVVEGGDHKVVAIDASHSSACNIHLGPGEGDGMAFFNPEKARSHSRAISKVAAGGDVRVLVNGTGHLVFESGRSHLGALLDARDEKVPRFPDFEYPARFRLDVSGFLAAVVPLHDGYGEGKVTNAALSIRAADGFAHVGLHDAKADIARIELAPCEGEEHVYLSSDLLLDILSVLKSGTVLFEFKSDLPMRLTHEEGGVRTIALIAPRMEGA